MANEGQGGGFWSQAAAGLITVGANAVGRGGPKRQYKYNKKLANFQNDLNKANAEWAFQKELELRKYQADYDSPQAQMQRLKDAGLNPNLMYGNGSAATGSFESPKAPNVPGVSVGQVDAGSLGSLGTDFNQARLMAAQTDLTRVREQESTVKKDLITAQTAVTKANPYLSEGYVKSMVSQMESVAKMKEQEASWRLRETWTMDAEGQLTLDAKGMQQMNAQLDLLFQKYRLGQQDAKIKAEIIQGKEFQNDLQKIQLDWLENGDITPEHIYRGIMMVLQQMMVGANKRK